MQDWLLDINGWYRSDIAVLVPKILRGNTHLECVALIGGDFSRGALYGLYKYSDSNWWWDDFAYQF